MVAAVRLLSLIILVMFLGCNSMQPLIAPHSDLFDPYTIGLEDINTDSKKKLKYANLHCTASRGEMTAEHLWSIFRQNGWIKPGYNYVVHMDGSVSTLVPIDSDGYVSFEEITNGVKGVNSVSVNIAYTGGVDSKLNPKDTRTEAQKEKLRWIVDKLRLENPDIIIMGHRDHKGVKKACPSFDVKKEFLN